MRHGVRIVGVPLALAVCAGLLPPGALAAETVEITLADSYLFEALREELGPDGTSWPGATRTRCPSA